jgi:hypothetical protein
MSHLLSKSKYIRGLQCEKALWLDVFRPNLARYSREQMRRFDMGREFEYAFKSTFPDAIDISAEFKRNVDAYPARTAQLLEKEEEVSLFEAGFLYDDVLVLADVVHKTPDGTLDIYEVKSGTALSDTYKHDAAVQHYVISQCRKVKSFSLVIRKAPSDPSDPSDQSAPSDHFSIINLTEDLASQHSQIAQNIAAMKEILSHGEPATTTGQHCLTPYACPYQHYCALGVRQMSLFG